MIIKSMARKEPSFDQLIDYMGDIAKSDKQYNVYQNIFSHDPGGIEEEFQSNAGHIPKRKNGNYMYHEILSITRAKKLGLKEQKRILRDLAVEYAKRRATSNLVFGTLHDDHDGHLHYHLLISSNASGESKKTRLSKAQFDKLKRQMENDVLKDYPELEQEVSINREAGEKLSRKGAERKRRTGKTPQRDKVKEKLHAIFASCNTKQEFFEELSAAGLEFYARGNTLGIKDLSTGRPHRLKTLGMLDMFHALSERIELEESQKTEKKSSHEPRGPEPDVKASKAKSETKEEPKIDAEQGKRKAEMDEIRSKQSDSDTSDKNQKK